MKIFPPREVWGRSVPCINLGPPHISDTIGARKLRFYTRLDKAEYIFRYDNFSARDCVGRNATSVNMGPPHISEAITAT